ncbi:hypothetical protein GXW84_42865 [Rhodococcus sp. IEGM 248]|nr:hypothetical protein [Rhodococcus sp. IEGM 248]
MSVQLENSSRQAVVDLADWHQVIARNLLPLAIKSSSSRCDFRADIRVRRTADMRLVTISGSPQAFERIPGRSDEISEPHFTLTLQLSGAGSIRHGDHEDLLRPGDIALCDWTSRYGRAFDTDFSVFTVMFPQRLMSVPASVLPRVIGRRISGSDGLGNVSSAMLTALSKNTDALHGGPGASVVYSAIQVGAAACCPSLNVPTMASLSMTVMPI